MRRAKGAIEIGERHPFGPRRVSNGRDCSVILRSPEAETESTIVGSRELGIQHSEFPGTPTSGVWVTSTSSS
jgi:hypothetical protein